MRYTDPARYDQRVAHPTESYIRGIWNPLLAAAIKKYITPKTVVCDLGCGTLEQTQHMGAARHIYAVDISPQMLSGGRAKISRLGRTITVLRQDALHTSLPVQSCDVIWSVGLSEYVDLQGLWTEIDRLAKPNATVVIQFPNQYAPYNLMVAAIKRLLGQNPKQFRRLSEMDAAAAAYGWRRQYHLSRGAILPLPRAVAHLATPIWPLGEHLIRPFERYYPLGLNILAIYARSQSTLPTSG